MRRVKNLYALIAAILVGCTSDYYRIPAVDEQEPVAIQFGAGSNRVHTRADLTGDAAANALGNAFHVYGTKDVNGITNIVYPNYVVEYNGAPLSTSSNSKGWEYVGLAAHPSQTLHYWDYSADSYTFQAWSGTTGGATVTIDSPSTLTIEAPTTDDLAQLYIADLVHVNKTDVGVLNTYGGIVLCPSVSVKLNEPVEYLLYIIESCRSLIASGKQNPIPHILRRGKRIALR